MEDRFLSSDLKLLQSGLFSDVTISCGDKKWQLHKNILCTRSVWFEKALNGNFAEAKSGHVEITNFEPKEIDCLVNYIYTGKCDIAAIKVPTQKTLFAACIEVYTVGDYFNLTPLTEIALDALKLDFDSKIGPMQLTRDEKFDWLDELLSAVTQVYTDIPLGDPSTSSSPLRQAFITFIHMARFYFLQDETFCVFLDRAPTFALDLFRSMRGAGDFVTQGTGNAYCTYCQTKPTRGEKRYFTHVATEKVKVVTACANCAVKKDLAPGIEDWLGKKGERGAGS